MKCKLCHGPTEFIFKIGGYSICECSSCRHRMTEARAPETHVPETYSDRYFYGDGAGYPNYLLEERMLMRHGSYYARIARKVLGKTGSVLDVGAAAGFILKGFSENRWLCTGVEPNEGMARHARNKLGLDVRTGTIESFVGEEKFDCVNLIQVIAHLIDPVSVVGGVRKFLKAHACVLVETWDYRSLTARLFGKRWHEYSPPSVLHWFSQESCDLLFARNGFTKIASGRPPKKIATGHALALIKFKTGNPVLLRVANAIDWIIPRDMEIAYPFDDVFWSIYRSKH